MNKNLYSGKKRIGKRGEELAVKYLRKNGYKILHENYRFKFGEIDIIGEDKECLCFIEVKSRWEDDIHPFYYVNKRKQKQLSKLALMYIKKYSLQQRDARFDVVGVKFKDIDLFEIELLKNAFELWSKYSY